MAVLSVIDNRLIFKRKLYPFNQALSLVGYDPVDTLEDVLKNSDACAALATNENACAIMKYNYRSEMSAAIDSNFNDGINVLNYKCALKCYLLKNGNECASITGGWSIAWANVLAGAVKSAHINDTGIYMMFKRDNGDGLYKDSCTASTANNIDANGYQSIVWVVTSLSGQGRKQMMYDNTAYNDGITSTGTKTFAMKSGTQKFYWSNVPHRDVGTQTCTISAVWLDPAEDEPDATTSDLDSAILDSMVLA